jgi:hypothetical protein
VENEMTYLHSKLDLSCFGAGPVFLVLHIYDTRGRFRYDNRTPAAKQNVTSTDISHSPV